MRKVNPNLLPVIVKYYLKVVALYEIVIKNTMQNSLLVHFPQQCEKLQSSRNMFVY